ncbi:3-deoxy-D-manno-octulosonic acid transferase [Elusimicrobiota bacterium]
MAWLILYNILFPLLIFVFSIAKLLGSRRSLIFKELLSARSWLERLGLSGIDPQARIWIHAASAGETKALKKFLQLAKLRTPAPKIHLSCTSSSARKLAHDEYCAPGLVSSVSYMPLDFWPIVWLYMLRLPNIKEIIIVETELWPSFIYEAKRRSKRLYLINARMSERTVRWGKRFKNLSQWLTSLFDKIILSGEKQKQNFIDIGAGQDILRVSGNMKLDLNVSGTAHPHGKARGAMRKQLGLGEKHILITGASTHPTEEGIIAREFLELRKAHDSLRLLVAPRHLERLDDVKRTLEDLGLGFALYSQITQSPAPESYIIILDTFGILMDLYSASDIIFMGGSFIKKPGGHNFLEPAAMSKPIIMGPMFANFREIADPFIKAGALEIVKDHADLGQALSRFIKDPDLRSQYGKNAQNCLFEIQGASQKTWEIIDS